ncbi:hypothetical protein PINS_up001968 [Pythium insidiosum]|nr:hypothetical protein PINS_up001968 [Pythium insidiosum]
METGVDEPSVGDATLGAVSTYEMAEELPKLDDSLSSQSCDDILRARLVASLLPMETASAFASKEEPVKHGAAADVPALGNDCSKPIVEASCHHTNSSTAATLRAIGLLEPEQDIDRSLSHPEDDEVSAEIRRLQRSLANQLRRNNEFKRTLRRTLERQKPWMTRDEEFQQVEGKFLKMWRRKKELERKKKHREKKQLRVEAPLQSSHASASGGHA